MNRRDYRTVGAYAVLVKRPQIDERDGGGHTLILSAGERAVAANHAGDVGAMTVEVIPRAAGVGGGSSGKVLVIDHARGAVGVAQNRGGCR